MHSNLKTSTNYKVYTPKRISRLILSKAVSSYFSCGDKKEKLDNLRMVDISCGTGNLIIEALEFLIRMSKHVYGTYTYNENWIEGYDIDEEALGILSSRAKEVFEKYGIQGQLKLYNENSLLYNFDKKYSIILGNPPYFGEKNNKDIFVEMKITEFGQKYYEAKMDYFYFFIEKGLDMLEAGGVLSYITTNYWLKADSATKLRSKIRNESNFIYINNYNKSVFKNAMGQHNMVFVLKKGSSQIKSQNEFKIVDEDRTYFSNNKDMYNHNGKIILADNKTISVLNSIYRHRTHFLTDLVNVNQGIVSGCDKAFVFTEFIEDFSKHLKAFYKNKDIHRYVVDLNNKFWILYLDKETAADKVILEYLENHRKKLEERREVKKNIINWWELQWSRDEKIFTSPKIVGRQRNKTNNFAYVEDDFYGSADIYYLTAKHDWVNLHYILGFLNSRVFYEWFKANGKSKGHNLELYSTPLKETPIYYPENSKKVEYVSQLVKKQIQDYSEEVQEEIEKYFRSVQ
jgi:adenine-specific DNA-methyltransferase